jgi:uncharacterized membrane protein
VNTARVSLGALVRGLPGHPTHPPLTDATIGAYTFATIASVLSVLGIGEDGAAQAWWLALVVALATSALTILTGLLDWLKITWGSELWKTATYHLLVMATATGLFGAAAIWGHGSGWRDHVVETGPFVLTLLGFAALTLGGWIGGTIVFVHGMRVLELPEEQAGRAISPVPAPEEEAAEG